MEVVIEPDAELTRAGNVLAVNGVRLLTIDGVATVGLWSDLDGPHIRAALARFHSGDWPVVYLDGPGIPDEYKGRVPLGQPVPLEVVQAMLDAGDEWPWVVRDRLLLAMKWKPRVRVYGV